jgi:serine/threonine protein kinase
LEQLDVNHVGHVNIVEDTSKPGDILDNHYMLTENVDRGGCGLVFRGMDLYLQREVAVKILSAEGMCSGDMLERFERESQILSQLHSQNIVHFYGCGRTTQGLPYIVMEFVHGRSLKDVLEKEGKLSPKQTVNVLAQVLHALEEAHSYGFVHCDLKPANIMLCPRPASGEDFVKVLDFGIAKVMQEDEGNVDISKGEMAGTPKYMPPEQFKNESLTPRADLYSLGCIAYEMLTGIAPFEGETFHATVAKHLFMTPKSFPPEIEQYPNLVGVVFKLLEKTPENRFATAQKAIEALNYWEDPLLIPALDGCRLKGDDSQGDSFIEFYDDENSSTMPVSLPADFAAALANVVPEGPMSIPSGQHAAVSMPGMQPVPMTRHDATGSRSLPGDMASSSPVWKLAIIKLAFIVMGIISLVMVIMLSMGLLSKDSETVQVQNVEHEAVGTYKEFEMIYVESASHTMLAAALDAVAFGVQENNTLEHLEDLDYIAESGTKDEVLEEQDQADKDEENKKTRRSKKSKNEGLGKFKFKLKYAPSHARVVFLNAQGRCDEGVCDIQTTSDTVPARIVVSALGYVTRSILLKKKVTDLNIELKPVERQE